MIYFGSEEGITVVLLEPANLKFLVDGSPIVSPDKKLIIGYTPDTAWTMAEIEKISKSETPLLTTSRLQEIIAEGLKRPSVWCTDPPPPGTPMRPVNPTTLPFKPPKK